MSVICAGRQLNPGFPFSRGKVLPPFCSDAGNLVTPFGMSYWSVGLSQDPGDIPCTMEEQNGENCRFASPSSLISSHVSIHFSFLVQDHGVGGVGMN